jgi:general nucleoside transport system permease protein
MASAVTLLMLVSFLTAGVRLATPLIFAACGGILCERSGVTDMCLEGMMISGAFGGYVGALITHSPWGGVLFSIFTGFLSGLLMAVFSVAFRADQWVIALGVNLFATGFTAFLYRIMSHAGTAALHAAKFEQWQIPVLSKIPIVGDIFFSQIPLVYIGYLLIPILSVILYRTAWGLKLRCVGEHPLAADTAGVNVWNMRIMAVALGGSLAGIGGAFLSVGEIGTFLEGIVAGRGFIALTAVIFGRYDPLKVAGACLLFGLADGLQLRLQSYGFPIPYQFLLMFPYFITLVVFVAFIRRVRPPAAMGKPYPPNI